MPAAFKVFLSRLLLYSSMWMWGASLTAQPIRKASMLLACFFSWRPTESMALWVARRGSFRKSAAMKNRPRANRAPNTKIKTAMSVTSGIQWAVSA